jgi:hypothetical protein
LKRANFYSELTVGDLASTRRIDAPQKTSTNRNLAPLPPVPSMTAAPAGFQPFPLHNSGNGVILRLFNGVEKRRVTDKHIQKPWRVNA